MLVHTECATFASEYVFLKQRLESIFIYASEFFIPKQLLQTQRNSGIIHVRYYMPSITTTRCCFPKKHGFSSTCLRKQYLHERQIPTNQPTNQPTNLKNQSRQHQPTDLKTNTPHPFEVIGRFLSHVAGIVLEPCHGKFKPMVKGRCVFLGSFHMHRFFLHVVKSSIYLFFFKYFRQFQFLIEYGSISLSRVVFSMFQQQTSTRLQKGQPRHKLWSISHGLSRVAIGDCPDCCFLCPCHHCKHHHHLPLTSSLS